MDLQDYISAYYDIAPNKIMDQKKILQDLDDEQEVVESLTNDKDTDILVQIREEKEIEFNKFIEGVKTYLTEDPKTVEEVELKKGIEGYLSLIDDDRNTPKLGKARSKVKLNTVSKLKNNLFDGKKYPTKKKISSKLNLSFKETESETSNKSELNVTSEKTQQAKKMLEKRAEVSSNK